MIKNTDLAKSISLKFGLPEKEAEHFVSTMFDVVNEALKEERQVKIKGLGTFKVTSVEARESVDVNTGLRITIDGRDKINFTPDAALRDRVNSPFAQFDTVEIADGVDFSAIDAKYSGESSQVQSSGDVTERVQEASKEEILPELEREPDASKVKPTEDDMPSNDKQENEANEQDQIITTDKEPIKQSFPMYDEEFLKKNTLQINTQLDKLNEQLNENIKRSNFVIKLLALTIVVLLLLLGGGIYYFTKQLDMRDHYIHQLEQLTTAELNDSINTENVGAVSENEEESTPAELTTEQQQQIKETIDEAAEKEQKEDVKAEEEKPSNQEGKKDEVKKSDENAASPYDSDPRVRTGAYRIVGVETTVTVLEGQTLKMISKAYLGPDMECYVEALNGKTSVKAGDKVKIPKLELKKRSK